MRTVSTLLCGLLVGILLLPQASACLDTEPQRIWDNQAPPAAEGLSPNKDGAIRETVEISKIGQETARFMLWRAMMGENLSEAQIRDEIDRAMIENGSNPGWPSFDTKGTLFKTDRDCTSFHRSSKNRFSDSYTGN